MPSPGESPPLTLASLRRAAEFDPRSHAARADLAVGLARRGRRDEAEAEVRAALELAPRYLPALWLLTQLKTFTPADPDLAALEAVAAESATLTEDELIRLCFMLAKALEDVGEYARAFEYLTRANALKRATFDYDVAADVHAMARVQAAFQPDLLRRLSGLGAESARPILIVGMPRSGTSLVEQILASHPQVHGGGERDDLARIAEPIAVLSGGRVGFPEGVAHLSAGDLASLGHGYDRRLAEGAGDAERVTDKTPFNFAYLGLLWLILARAPVIHCARDPLDTCVSCFKVDFGKVRFASDLAELGRYYRAYAHLMEHWRRVLPRGWILEVRYEELVADLEGQTRRMLGHCGLTWDERCLEFQSTERIVQTASFAQVHQPVHERSVGRWRDYEPWLGPLITAVAG